MLKRLPSNLQRQLLKPYIMLFAHANRGGKCEWQAVEIFLRSRGPPALVSDGTMGFTDGPEAMSAQVLRTGASGTSQLLSRVTVRLPRARNSRTLPANLTVEERQSTSKRQELLERDEGGHWVCAVSTRNATWRVCGVFSASAEVLPVSRTSCSHILLSQASQTRATSRNVTHSNYEVSVVGAGG